LISELQGEREEYCVQKSNEKTRRPRSSLGEEMSRGLEGSEWKLRVFLSRKNFWWGELQLPQLPPVSVLGMRL